MSVHENEEISIDELENALESRNASIMEKWFNQTGPKELGETQFYSDACYANSYGLLNEVIEWTVRGVVSEGLNFETAIANAMYEWDL